MVDGVLYVFEGGLQMIIIQYLLFLMQEKRANSNLRYWRSNFPWNIYRPKMYRAIYETDVYWDLRVSISAVKKRKRKLRKQTTSRMKIYFHWITNRIWTWNLMVKSSSYFHQHCYRDERGVNFIKWIIRRRRWKFYMDRWH